MTREELVDRYRETVYRYALSLTREPVEAEDLTQESLLKALRGLERFRGESTTDSWLYRITMNAWKNRLRARASRAAEPLPELEPPSGEPTPEALAERSERERLLERCLQRLEPAERAVLLRREVNGEDYATIARAEGVPLGTVKSRLSRARAMLRAVALALLASLALAILGGVWLKRQLPGLFAQIQSMISGAAGNLGGSGEK